MEEQKHAEIPSNPSLYKRSYFSEKNNLITRSISKFISVISFSIEIIIKELMAKNGGHVNPGGTVVKAGRYRLTSETPSKCVVAGSFSIR